MTDQVFTSPAAQFSLILQKHDSILGHVDTIRAQIQNASGSVLSGRTISWTTSDAKIVSISPGGSIAIVKAENLGTASIRASVEGLEAKLDIHVTMPPLSSITAGTYFTCGIASNSDGALCWGENFYAQLGRAAEFTDSIAPGAVVQPADGRFVQAMAGSSHTCALNGLGAAYCWGRNDSGQVGNGTIRQAPRPVAVLLPDIAWDTLVAGMLHTCGISRDRRAYCWGANAHGQLGTGNRLASTTPNLVKFPTAVVPKSLAAGRNHTCAVSTDNRLWCWGLGESGQLGSGGVADQIEPATVITGGVLFSSITAGSMHSCGVSTSGRAYCWGTNSDGQLGAGLPGEVQRTPVAVASQAGVSFVSLTAGMWHTCGLATNPRVAYCWGANAYGQLGTGDVLPRTSPAAVTLTGLSLSIISAGHDHTCAIAAEVVYCWGHNNKGQLGLTPDELPHPSPQRVMR